jgi:hypothetical protein
MTINYTPPKRKLSYDTDIEFIGQKLIGNKVKYLLDNGFSRYYGGDGFRNQWREIDPKTGQWDKPTSMSRAIYYVRKRKGEL